MKEDAFTSLEEYRRYVKARLDGIYELLYKISSGDYFERPDLRALPEDEFRDAFAVLNILIDHLQKIRQESEAQNRRHSLVADIWKIAYQKKDDEVDLAYSMLSLTGAYFNVARASFYRIDAQSGEALCVAQWQRPGLSSSIGLRIPPPVVSYFMDKEYAVLRKGTFPPQFETILGKIFDTYNIATFVAVPFRESGRNLEGFFSFSHDQPNHEWSREEIQILWEIVRIFSLRASSRRAEEELRASHQRLEEEVRLRTAELQRVNEQLMRDIEERRRAEKELAENERFLENVFASIQDGISILDTNYTIIRVNPTMERLYSHAMPLLGKKCYQAYHCRDTVCDVCPTRQTLHSQAPAYEEVPLHGAGGALLGWLDLYTFPLFDTTSGQLKGIIEYVRNITERRKAEKALAEEMEFLNVMLRSIVEAVISTDKDGKITLLNPTAEQFTGWRKEEALGKAVDEVVQIIAPDTRTAERMPIARVKETGRAVNILTTRALISKDGIERLICYSIAPICDGSSTPRGMVIVMRDITERERMAQEVFKAAKLESLGLLASGIAHDFNNFLTAIVTNLFIAKMSLGENDEVRQLITDAEKAAFRASRLTKQLLTFSKGSSPVKEKTSLKNVIEDAVGFCLSGSHVDYRLELADDLEMVEIDRGQIDQLINNLVINADQAMPNGGTIKVKAENCIISENISTGTAAALPLPPGKYVKVSISDEGVGIPPRDLQRIFDPYFTTKQHGSGLGLTTAFSIVQKHGGHLTVKSVVGKGSTFSFYLPAASEGTEDYRKGEQKLEQSPYRRVLVMDDDELVRMVVQRLLSTHGYHVDCANNGRDAVEKYQRALADNRRYDVVIMDLTVPGGMSGKEAARTILEIDREAKIIAFSGSSNDPVMTHYREYGFAGVIAKPFSIDEFSRQINKLIHR